MSKNKCLKDSFWRVLRRKWLTHLKEDFVNFQWAHVRLESAFELVLDSFGDSVVLQKEQVVHGEERGLDYGTVIARHEVARTLEAIARKA